MAEFDEVRERESDLELGAEPVDTGTTAPETTRPAHEEPEARRRVRHERLIHRGRSGVGYPRPFRVRF